MKYLITILLVFSIQYTFAQAREDSPNSTCGTKGIARPDTQAEMNEVEKLTNQLEKENLKVLANQICSAMNSALSSNTYDVLRGVNRYISTFLNLDPKQDNSKEIFEFWSKNSKDLICEVDSSSEGRKKEHVLKRAIALQIHNKLFYQYLFRAGHDEIFNAVEIVDGEEETILDYIDKIMQQDDFEDLYEPSEVKKLRHLLANKFGAKTAQELREQKENN